MPITGGCQAQALPVIFMSFFKPRFRLGFYCQKIILNNKLASWFELTFLFYHFI
jgi:hypothetical protein